jgi:hypothetical protein
MDDFKALQAQAAKGQDAMKALDEYKQRMDKVSNLLSGKTADDTANLPPEIVQRLSQATSSADMAWRKNHALSLAFQAGAHDADAIAQLLINDSAFSVKPDGNLKDSASAVAAMTSFKTRSPWAFKQDAPPPEPPSGPPLPSARPPTPPNQQPGVPVAPVELSESQFAALTIAEARKYVAAQKAARH